MKYDTNKSGQVVLYGANGQPLSRGNADGAASLDNILAVVPGVWGNNWFAQRAASFMSDAHDGVSFPPSGRMQFNGATWERGRGNTEGTLLALAARTAAIQATLTNHNGRYLILYFSVTARAAATTMGLALRDATGAAWGYATVSTVPGTISVVAFGPGVVQADMQANYSTTSVIAKSIPLPRSIVIETVPSDSNSVTFQLLYSLGV